MTYNSKKIIAGMAAGTLTVAAYVAYAAFARAAAGANAAAGVAGVAGLQQPDDVRSWAKLLLAFIAIGVAAQIAVQIAFHVAFAVGVAVKEREKDERKIKRIMEASMVEDERDKLIILKSLRIGRACSGAGFIAALFALAGGAPAAVALHVALGACAAASFAEGCAGVFLNEKGVKNGR